MRKTQTVGLLGGMGPYASEIFYKLLLDLTPAKKDWDHLRVVIDSNPHIPSRSRHVLYGETSPVDGMIESCRKLAAWPVDFIVIPCNSACYFLPDVRPAVDVPIIDIIETTVDALACRTRPPSRVAVLGGAVTHKKASYELFLKRKGYTYVSIPDCVQSKVEAVIELIKTQDMDKARDGFLKVLDAVTETCAADVVVLGCTELTFFRDVASSCKLVDSSFELARAAISRAVG